MNQALSYHPYSFTDQWGNKIQPTKGYLQQAPYAFKTVTKALAYINTHFRTSDARTNPTSGELPWKKPKEKPTHPQLWIDYIVIQCYPGIYGPKKDKGGFSVPIDQKSGLPFNGEEFPLQLPDRVSLQGTSALDTIFDAREYDTHIIQMGQPLGQPGVPTYEYSFIDSLTIRGARCSEEKKFPAGAGVLIAREDSVYAVISNCFITDNWVGIAIDNDEDYESYRHSPIIVNNTIAWNRVGIWSGNSIVEQPQIGYAFPRVFNNIMDSSDPYGRFGAINSTFTAPFWGLDPSDMRIQGIAAGDFNAFESNRAQAVHGPGSTFSLPHWLPTRSRTGSSAQYSPRVDIKDYTRAGQLVARGSLYINDIFRNSQPGDRSPHDFRLAPLVSKNVNAPINPQSLNILVNQGIVISGTALQFTNLSPAITRAPGLPGPGAQSTGAAADYASFHCWDWDGEGYGNARVVPRTGFSAGAFSDCDFGADEMGKLMVGGYIDRTRIFSQCIPDGSGTPGAFLPITPHVEMYFFDLPGNHNRPQYVQWTGRNYAWWDYTQSGVSIVSHPNPVQNYTKGLSGTMRFAYVISGWQDFMRSLECDASPHLLPDYHPLWGTMQNLWNQPSQAFNDIFASNPWVQHTDSRSMHADNRWLYYDTTVYAVLEGTSNPPGSWLWVPTWGFLGPGPYGVLGPFGYPGTTQYTVPSTPAWGYGDSTAGGPDIIPDSNWLGVRYCAEVDNWLSNSNMQTFLGVNGVCIVGPGKSTRGKAPKVKLVASPGKKEFEAMRTSVRAEIRRRGKLGGRKK